MPARLSVWGDCPPTLASGSKRPQSMGLLHVSEVTIDLQQKPTFPS